MAKTRSQTKKTRASVFGVSQVIEYVGKTGKNTVSIKQLSKALNISESSAKRYVHEAVKLGVLLPEKKNRYRIDLDKARLYLILARSDNLWEALLEMMQQLMQKNLPQKPKKEEKLVPITLLIPQKYYNHIEFILRHSVRGGKLEKLSSEPHNVYLLRVPRPAE
jgi:predicted transcriptional regulator